MTEPQRAGLDRGRVVAAALALVDEEGLTRLSMRNLASRLGVEAMSLYSHVANKDDLVTEAVGLVFAEIEMPEESPEDWVSWIRALALETYAVLLRHANVIPLLAEKGSAAEQTQHYLEQMCLSLIRAGLSHREAFRVVDFVTAHIFASALAMSAHPRRPPAGERTPELTKQYWAYLDESDRVMTFRATLDLILAGLRAEGA